MRGSRRTPPAGAANEDGEVNDSDKTVNSVDEVSAS